jgi:hypothetical protein
MVAGDEEDEVFQAILESMTAVEDYEVNESSVGEALRSPP